MDCFTLNSCIITCTVFQNPGCLPLNVIFGPVFEVTRLTRDSREEINRKWNSEEFCPYTKYGDEGVYFGDTK